MNENETRTRTEREQYIENNHTLPIEGDPGTEQSVIISKTEQEPEVPEQTIPEQPQENHVDEQSVIISKTEPEKEPESEPIITPTIPEEEQEPQANPVTSTVVQDVSHCVTKTDIDN